MSETAPSIDRSVYVTTGIAAGIALVLAIILYIATGPTLGLFFGGVLIVTLLLPPMVLCHRPLLAQALVASAVHDAVAIVWLGAVIRSDTTLLQWLACYVLLAAYAFALWGMARALRANRTPDVPAAAVTIILALLWLTWPIWLSRALDDALVRWLVPAHPLLALNGVLTNLGIWSEHAIAYRLLMNLGQDVAYQLPGSIVPGVFVHIIAGGIGFGIASMRRQD